jgi:hypothetical protein
MRRPPTKQRHQHTHQASDASGSATEHLGIDFQQLLPPGTGRIEYNGVGRSAPFRSLRASASPLHRTTLGLPDAYPPLAAPPKGRRHDLIALTEPTAAHMRNYLAAVHALMRKACALSGDAPYSFG